eukprot:3277429-Lingulodinium_polyedra.AAC.1
MEWPIPTRCSQPARAPWWRFPVFVPVDVFMLAVVDGEGRLLFGPAQPMPKHGFHCDYKAFALDNDISCEEGALIIVICKLLHRGSVLVESFKEI